MSDVMQLEVVLPGLHASAAEPLPFAPALRIRAFLLQRDHGNLLVYSATGLESDTQAIREFGGAARHYLNHWHEAMFMPRMVFAPLFVHEKDATSASERTRVDATFSGRHMLDDDFEVIPIAGHTSGATAYLWDSGEHRVLFTGDTIYLDDGEWVAAVLDSSDRTRYIHSLELIRNLDFDVLVPWAASEGRHCYTATNNADAARRIDAILARLRRGENS